MQGDGSERKEVDLFIKLASERRKGRRGGFRVGSVRVMAFRSTLH
jgi:hypothetical protein